MARDHRTPRHWRGTGLVGTELNVAKINDSADDVLTHSEDEGEWEDEPEQIESRPSGTQVVSARLPTALAEELLSKAAHMEVRPSELIRQAVDAFLHGEPRRGTELTVYEGNQIRVVTPKNQYRTENSNLVVEVPAEPAHVVALGF